MGNSSSSAESSTHRLTDSGGSGKCKTSSEAADLKFEVSSSTSRAPIEANNGNADTPLSTTNPTIPKKSKRRRLNNGGSVKCDMPSSINKEEIKAEIAAEKRRLDETKSGEYDTPRTPSNASKLPYIPDNAQRLPPTTEFDDHSFLQTSLLMNPDMIKQAMKVVHDHKGTNNSSRLLIQSMVQLLKDKNDGKVNKREFKKRFSKIEKEWERIVDEDTSYKGRVNRGDDITLATKLLVLLHWAVPGEL